VRNETVRDWETTGQETLETTVKKSQLQCFGHVEGVDYILYI